MIPTIFTFSVLTALLLAAVWCDVRRHRIPNTLNVVGLAAGLVVGAAAGGWHGLGTALAGIGVGLACYLPFYLLRGMGAGDVKLLAAIGAFLDPVGVAYAALFSMLAGGLAAIGHVLWQALRASAPTLVTEGLSAAGASAFVAAGLARRDRLPFALPIAVGSLAAVGYYLNSARVGAWLLANFT